MSSGDGTKASQNAPNFLEKNDVTSLLSALESKET